MANPTILQDAKDSRREPRPQEDVDILDSSGQDGLACGPHGSRLIPVV